MRRNNRNPTTEPNYSERKAISRLARATADEARDDLDDSVDQYVAQQVHNAVYDAILTNDCLAELLAMRERCYEASSAFDDDDLDRSTFRAAEHLNDAVDRRVEQIVDDVVATTIEHVEAESEVSA